MLMMMNFSFSFVRLPIGGRRHVPLQFIIIADELNELLSLNKMHLLLL